MKPISLFVLGVLAVAMSASAQAQSTDPIAKAETTDPIAKAETTDPIEKALLAAPNLAMAKDATVIKWNSDFTYETLKKGTSRVVCYDLSGWPGERGPFSVECTSSEANLPRVAQNRKFAAEGGGDPKKIEELVAAAGRDGTRLMSEVGSIWFNLFGKSEATALRHWFVAMPGLRGDQVGLPEVRDAGGAWLMLAGTPEAHIMLPTGTGPGR
jgi:hypothetical protein